MEGLLLIDKPEGVSSFGVVAKVRWIITQEKKRIHQERGFCTEVQSGRSTSSAVNRTETYDERAAQATESGMHSEPIKHTSLHRVNDWRCKCRVKVGHSGTLDPAATGLLVLAIGGYTKRIPELIKHNKTYEVTMTLGKTSTTGDKEGEITDISAAIPSQKAVEDVLQKFTGELMQTPPIFSAIKINGQRAYDLARKGKEVTIEPRKATIYSNTVTSYNYPIVTFTSKVGSGTYIRSLVEDIGKELGVGAYMSDLRRTQIDSFSVVDALRMEDVNTETVQNHLITLEK